MLRLRAVITKRVPLQRPSDGRRFLGNIIGAPAFQLENGRRQARKLDALEELMRGSLTARARVVRVGIVRRVPAQFTKAPARQPGKTRSQVGK